MVAFDHETVLLTETIEALDPQPQGIYVDCTLGGAGHAQYLLENYELGHLYAFDQDQVALDHARETLKPWIDQGLVTLIHRNFRDLKEALNDQGVHEVDGIYYDFGVSSPQLDQAMRGFSYHQEAPLDMRMDQSQALTAREVVNDWPYEDLVRIISRYGEERFAKRIARSIESQRRQAPIETTTELAELVKTAIPAATRRTGGHPAKRTFQAIRIAVNDELSAIEDSLDQAIHLLRSGGRLAAISFHSLEDRIVKQMFQEVSTPPDLPRNLPVLPDQIQVDYRMVTRKPILASQDELTKNNRARSAKLRILERK